MIDPEIDNTINEFRIHEYTVPLPLSAPRNPTHNEGKTIIRLRKAIQLVKLFEARARIIDSYDGSLSLGSIETIGANWAAYATGKNVAQNGDTLTWMSPSTGSTSANPGQTETFQVKLSEPISNVRIDFSAVLQPPTGPSQTLSSTYVNSMQAFTDSGGIASVSVTVPSDTPLGSKITVQASTQSVWPYQYLDLNAYSDPPSLQDVMGLGPTLGLTVSTNIYVLGYITVLPESALGALSAFVAAAAAFVIYTKFKQQQKLTNP